jgi:voltage-gated potassium channel
MKDAKGGGDIRRRIFSIIQIGYRRDRLSRLFDITLAAMIIINILVLILETFEELSPWHGVFVAVETVTVLFFIVEYILRIWTADFLYPGLSRPRAIWRFVTSVDGIVQLLTILPFFFLSGFVVFRLLRVLRIFRLFRINAYYDSFNVIWDVLAEKKNQILSSLCIILILMIASSLSMYSAEHEAQPELFKNAFSGIWWSVSALLTVGYGDIYPITPLGCCMAIVISFLGVGAVAIPTGIISAGFVERVTSMNNKEKNSLEDYFQRVHVDIDSSWIGRTREELEQQDNILIILTERNGRKEKPGPDFRVMLGDRLVVYSREQ